MGTVRVVKVLLAGFMLAWMLLLPGTAQDTRMVEGSPNAEPATYKAIYLYTSDAATAASYQAALSQEDIAVTLFRIEGSYHMLYMPLIMRNASGAATAQGPAGSPIVGSPMASLLPVGAQATPDLSGYDLILVGPDTGARAMWQGSGALTAAISETLRPVVALGAGGHAFLGRLGLDIGHPHGSEVLARSAQVGDPSTLSLIWNGARTVARTGDVAQLYDANVHTVAVPLVDRLPDGLRVAALPTHSEQYPIVIEAERFILWGFSGAADHLTTAGKNLLLNLIGYGEMDIQVPLKARTFTPPQGIEPGFGAAMDEAGGALHALVQLRRPVNPTEHETLKGLGVTLMSHLSGLTYLGLVDPTTDLGDPELLALVRWMGQYRPGDRVHPDVAQGQLAAYNVGPAGAATLTVRFFPEVSETEVQAILEAYGATVVAQRALNTWTVVMDDGQIAPLSEEEDVRWIDQGPGPNQDVNDGARALMGTDVVVAFNTATGEAAGLDGSGVRAAVMESPVDTTHPDLTGRFVYTYGTPYKDHSTHVAGIIGADGSQSLADGGTAHQWRGHAPGITLMSVPYGRDDNVNYDTAINDHGADITNHSYKMTDVVYDTVAAGVDSIVRGDESCGGDAIPARLVVWATGNEGWRSQWTNEEGFFSVTSPAKNALSVGSMDSDSSDLSRFSGRGPTFDNRIKPDVVAPGCERNSGIRSTVAIGFFDYHPYPTGDGVDDYTDPYDLMCGTSMATPATVGALSLALEKYFDLYNTTDPPYPSTLKGLAIHTAVDLQRDFANPLPGQLPQSWNDADLCQDLQTNTTPISPTCAVLYHPGPDYSTGYGQVNVPSLVEQVQHRGFVEGSLEPTDTTDTYTVEVLANRPEIRFTLVWDDEPGDTATAETDSKLTNDLDLTLTAPDGTVYHPWILDPLTPNASPGNGGFDSVTRADVTAAYRGVDRRNNVEQVSVADALGVMPGTWSVRVRAHHLTPGHSQSYSLIGDFRQLNIVGGQTLVSSGFPVNAGSTANPDKILLRVKIKNPLVAPSFTENYTTTDFLVEVGETGDWQSADVLSVFQVGGEVAIDVRPPAGMDAGVYHDVRVTLVGIDDDTQTNALYFVEADEVAGYFLTDTSGSMEGGKIQAAREAGKALVDLLRVDDWVGVGHFGTVDHHLMDVTQVVGDSQLSTARGYIAGLSESGATAMGPGMDLARQRLNGAALPGDTQKIVFLLSDGMENTTEPEAASPPTVGCWDNHPDWDCEDNPPYVKTGWPSDIQAYVVCLGEAGAAWHAFCDQVATDTSGPPVWHVYDTPETASTTGSSAAAELERSSSTWEARSPSLASIAAGHFDHPTTLEVRLDDAYLDMGQTSHGWPRMLEWTGWISPVLEYVPVPIEVEEHVPVIYITLEWDDPGAYLDGRLERPGGVAVDPSDADVLYYRQDDTHVHWAINDPEPAEWRLQVIARERRAEYLVTASGPSDIEMRLLVDPDDTFRYDEIKVCALLTDNAPIPGSSPASAAFNVIDPGGVAHWDWLFDDGNHDDGWANDGVYCGRYTGVDRAGVYQVKAIAAGTANDSRSFVRRATGYTYRAPKVLYVYQNGDIARQYRDLLKANGTQVDLVDVDSLSPGSHDLSEYALIIIGPATANRTDWGTAAAFEALRNQRRPTLGLGQGGYAFYGELDLYIGRPNGSQGNERDVYAVDLGHDVWQLPHDLKLTTIREVRLYGETSSAAIYIGPDTPEGVELLGQQVNDSDWYTVVRQVTGQRGDELWNHCLWGYDEGPWLMTNQGKRLFFNVAWYMMD